MLLRIVFNRLITFLNSLWVHAFGYIALLAASLLVAFFEMARDYFFGIMLFFIDLFLDFVELVYPAGLKTVGDYFQDLPVEVQQVMATMKVYECLTILLFGMVVGLSRRLFFRV